MPSELSTVTGEQSVEALRHELAEAREQQAASAEILRVISSAPTDLKRVCAEIAASAARLCDAYDVAIGEVIGDKLHLVAHYGPIPTTPAVPLIPGALPSRAALDRRTIHVPDLQAETAEYPEGSDRARRLGFRTILAVPLMRAGEAIGAIAIRRAEVRPFTDRQIDLLKTFADQAVIAIENTRLFEAEQTRAKELQDRSAELVQSLEYQTAISEVLGVISKSPNNVRPVFETIITMAERLCGADFGFVYRLEDDGRYHLVAAPRASETYRTYRAARPVVPGDESIMGRTLLERRAIRVSDVKSDPEQTEIEAHRRGNIRSALAAPLISAGKAIGVMGVARSTARPFSQRQVALIETFANQAVIAIENTRLFEEVQTRTRERSRANTSRSSSPT
jgi:two-component system, NtrC family, sensor kinase